MTPNSLCGLHEIGRMSDIVTGTLLMRRQMVSWGISSQMWTRASMSSRTVWGATWWQSRMVWNIMSPRCPGELGGGQSVVLSPSSCRTCLHTLATWGWALSCTAPRSPFLIVWSETFPPVACWRSFCRAVTVLVLFLPAQRSRYWSCSGFEDLLQTFYSPESQSETTLQVMSSEHECFNA